MHPKRYALYGGILMLIGGLAALMPSWSSSVPTDFPSIHYQVSYGLFLGIFPMNIFNKVALILFGLTGISAANSKNNNLPMSILWSRGVFFLMGLVAVLGLIPSTQTVNGYWPLFGNEVYAHAAFAAAGLYFGYMLKHKAHQEIEKRFTPEELHQKVS